MTDRVIQLVQDGSRSKALNLTKPDKMQYPATDTLHRRVHDLRISVTDRCNFRCVYCMPKSVFDKDYQFLAQKELLTFEEIEHVAKIFVKQGVEKIRLTGGEPLLRKNLEVLIEKLAHLKTPNGSPVEITLTTNGTLLPKKAKTLKDAGLSRVTVSLDAMSESIFRQLNDVDFSVNQVLEGIEAAHQAGLGTVKVNMVVKKSANLNEIVPMAQYFRDTPHILRFIEFMDVGSSNGWNLNEVVPSREVLKLIHDQVSPLQVADPNYKGEVAERWHYADGKGEIGVISSVTQAFCKDCSRVRLSTEGQLFTCLFATQGHDIKPLLRPKDESLRDEQLLENAIYNLWGARQDRYSEIRSENTIQPKNRIEMSYIGG